MRRNRRIVGIESGMATSEAARLETLRKYRILDTKPEQAFDDLTLLASQIFKVPIALITLIDEDRQWFKSRVGISVTETHRSVAFCAHAIQQPGLFVVPDARRDERFRENPFVLDDPRVRFYAGAPLITREGHALGTICVIDQVPRNLSADEAWALEALRRQTQAQLELRRNLMELEGALAERDQAEADQTALVKELRKSLDKVDKLSELMPYCSACELNMVIPATPSAIPKVSEGLQQLLQGKHWSEDEVMQVVLALDEALANAIRHGCKGDPTKSVQCIVTHDAAGDLTIVVRDPGPGFDVASVPNPLEGQNVFKSSGRGVFLINQLMDEVAFADGGREVQMRKKRTFRPEEEKTGT
jgi:anti-sigma regulatory factor (Ser/Thr protein kinase)